MINFSILCASAHIFSSFAEVYLTVKMNGIDSICVTEFRNLYPRIFFTKNFKFMSPKYSIWVNFPIMKSFSLIFYSQLEASDYY